MKGEMLVQGYASRTSTSLQNTVSLRWTTTDSSYSPSVSQEIVTYIFDMHATFGRAQFQFALSRHLHHTRSSSTKENQVIE